MCVRVNGRRRRDAIIPSRLRKIGVATFRLLFFDDDEMSQRIELTHTESDKMLSLPLTYVILSPLGLPNVIIFN